VSIREIAHRLERNASAVGREQRRNTAPRDRGKYDAPLAHSLEHIDPELALPIATHRFALARRHRTLGARNRCLTLPMP
jgi:hypothetical protein